MVALRENAKVPAAARKTTREAPTRVSVNPSADGPGVSVEFAHSDWAASMTAAGEARALLSVVPPGADVAAAALISAAVAFTATPMRADRIKPTALTLTASSQRGHMVGITATGIVVDASTCPVTLLVTLQATVAESAGRSCAEK